MRGALFTLRNSLVRKPSYEKKGKNTQTGTERDKGTESTSERE